MTKLKTSLLAASILALPLAVQAPAQAQPVNGLYVGAGAGVNWLQKQDHSARTNTFELYDYYSADASVHGKWNPRSRIGFVGLASIGWGFGNGLRAELEGSYRENSLRTGSFSGGVTVDGHDHPLNDGTDNYVRGRSSQFAVMVNALYDLDIGQNWIYPYVGAGVGYSWQRFKSFGAYGEGSGYGDDYEEYAGIGHYTKERTVGRFAYQAIAGAAFPIAAIPGLSLTAEYRFFGTVGSPKMRVSGGGGVGGCFYEIDGCDYNGNDYSKSKVSPAYNHSLLLGVRYAFNAAPAAVAAPPPVVPAGKSFLVFFDWDKSTLTDRARGIIKEAAAASKATKHTVVEVNGYADTSGNPKYNMGLSMRRAQTVAAELVRNGVPKQEIAIKAFGDTVLLVPTGPGVREPQNRRVEIIIK